MMQRFQLGEECHVNECWDMAVCKYDRAVSQTSRELVYIRGSTIWQFADNSPEPEVS